MNDIKKKLKIACQINGQIIASVKSGLLISAQINLTAIGTIIDITRSKYIISQSNIQTIGKEAYEKGEPITSFQTNTINFMCKAGTYYVRCIVFNSEGESIELVSNPVETSGTSITFDYEGKPNKISLFKGQYKLEVWGAKGGNSIGKGKRNDSSPVEGGLGGYSCGTLKLNENKIIYIFVGGQGCISNSSDGSITNGGFPDGGSTKTGHCLSNHTTVPGTGGGSTSIRIGSASNYSRLIVAGGGGGASGDSYHSNKGGFGGGLNGGNIFYRGNPHTQGAGTQIGSSNGLGYYSDRNGDPGTFGSGAAGKYCKGCDSGGGGGGGWYGGGSGGYGANNCCSSGGGGSGWVFTESSLNAWKSGDPENASKVLLDPSYYLSGAESKNGSEEFTTPDGKGKECGHNGNGFTKITIE